MSFDSVVQLMSSEFDSESAAGFPRVLHIPDTQVHLFIEVWKTLTSGERAQMKFAVAYQAAAFLLLSDDSPQMRDPRVLATNRWFADKKLALAGDSRFVNVRSTHLMFNMRDWLPEWMQAQCNAAIEHDSILDVIPAKAKEIRKELRQLLLNRYGAKAENLGGGEWEYSGTLNGKLIEINIDFGGKGDQLRYGIAYDGIGMKGFLPCANFEKLLGVGFGNWNMLTTSNLQTSLDLLCNLIEDTATILSRVKPLLDKANT